MKALIALAALALVLIGCTTQPGTAGATTDDGQMCNLPAECAGRMIASCDTTGCVVSCSDVDATGSMPNDSSTSTSGTTY